MAIAQRPSPQASIDASIRYRHAWNMHDPEKHLQKPEFLALLSALNNYPLTDKAVQAIIENSADIVIAGPTAVVVLFAEWVRGTFKKTKSSVRCLVAFIIDLTLTMDTLFLSCAFPRSTLIKIALVIAHSGCTKVARAPCYVVIKTITDIIMDNSMKPEQWAMTEERFDESWMPIEALREP
ncbi:hypothetical protein B0H14DRAFT_2896700 [Mycena olivaceomarginata]|nr:hypothetical protein B0H14DRAFT_2896700 [Mycena olivaceomarginata]